MNEKYRPTTEDFRKELERMEKKSKYIKMLRSTLYILLSVAAMVVLVATLWLPILEVTGNSMEPNLSSGDIIVSVKNAEIEQGDVVAFYYNNKILLKRVIGTPGDEVTIEMDGTTSVNGVELEEAYVTDKSLGESDLEYPYQVPDSEVFVMGDHRSTSIDSRLSSVGTIPKEYIVGKVYFRIWPLNKIGGF